MSDFSRISDEVISSVYVRFGSEGVPSRVEHVREFLEWLEPLLVAPHIAYIIGKSTPEESSQGYVGGMVRRLMEVEDGLTEALDDLNPRNSGVTRTSRHVHSDGDLVITNNSSGDVYGNVSQVGTIYGGINTRGGRR